MATKNGVPLKLIPVVLYRSVVFTHSQPSPVEPEHVVVTFTTNVSFWMTFLDASVGTTTDVAITGTAADSTLKSEVSAEITLDSFELKRTSIGHWTEILPVTFIVHWAEHISSFSRVPHEYGLESSVSIGVVPETVESLNLSVAFIDPHDRSAGDWQVIEAFATRVSFWMT